MLPGNGTNLDSMIAATVKSLALSDLPVGWFDFVFVAVLAFGVFRGRTNGMTKEFLPLCRWVGMVLAGILGYEVLGDIFHNFFGLSRAGSFSLGYVALAFVVFLMFIPVDGFLTPRLTGSNIFGSAEYYLGIFAGLVRYLSIILFALALINSPRYSVADIQAQKEFAAKTFGGSQQGFNGDFFPTFQQVQAGIFKNSLIGSFIKDRLAVVLINSAPVGSIKPTAKPR